MTERISMSESTGEDMTASPKSPETVVPVEKTEKDDSLPRKEKRFRRFAFKVPRGEGQLGTVRDQLKVEQKIEVRSDHDPVLEGAHPRADGDKQSIKIERKLDLSKAKEKNEQKVKELTEVAKTGSFTDVWEKAIDFYDLPIPEGKEAFYKNELPTIVNTMVNGNAEEKRDAEAQLKALMENNNLSRKEKLQLRAALPLVKRAMRHKEMPVGRDEREHSEEQTVQPAPPEASEDTSSPEEREATGEVTEVINKAEDVANSDEPDEIKMGKWQKLMIKLKEFGDTKIPHTILTSKNEEGEERKFWKWLPLVGDKRIGVYLPFVGGKTVKENTWGAVGILMTVAASLIIAYLWGVASLGKVGGK